ncbi:MAG: UbiX family flavin prenyltransferase [Acidobacteria bacterium]|nr:UbiX family flavin prenyltransferase [Acidobacteriota bacterium]
MTRLIIGVTGATGTVYAVRLLQLLQRTEIETHLVMSRWGQRTLLHETNYTREEVEALADHVHNANDQGAPISSGSFLTAGMMVVPCSVRSLAAIAHGLGEHLVHRAADVVLKERRKLLLAVREAPLSEIHLENMLRLSRMGAIICPPVPAFYQKPATLDDLVTQTCRRMLDQFGIHLDGERWSGEMAVGED